MLLNNLKTKGFYKTIINGNQAFVQIVNGTQVFAQCICDDTFSVSLFVDDNTVYIDNVLKIEFKNRELKTNKLIELIKELETSKPIHMDGIGYVLYPC